MIKIMALCSLVIFLLFGCASKPSPVPASAPWLTQETTHLILHYQPGSFAAANLQKAISAYESSYRYAVKVLPFVNNRAKLDVYLHDSLSAAGHANRENRSSHYVYSKRFTLTSPHEMMHHFLYEMNPNVPLRFEEGVARLFEVRTTLTGRKHLFQLARLSPQHLLDVREVFKDDYKTDVEGNVAAAFSAFLVDKMGWQAFWKFYNGLDKTRWGLQLEAIFKEDMSAINQEFRTFVRGLNNPPALF